MQRVLPKIIPILLAALGSFMVGLYANSSLLALAVYVCLASLIWESK